MPDVVPVPPRPRRPPLDRVRATSGAGWVLTASLTVLAVVVFLAARFTYDTAVQLWLNVAAVAAFVPAVLAVRRLDTRGALRRATRLLFGVAFLLNLLAVTGPPGTSDDDWRYLWDGRVQMHGIDPYRYSARAAELRDIRTDAIFPPQRPCHYHKFAEDGLPEEQENGCTRMNRPRVNTIYPPVAEAFFAVMYVVTFGGHGNEFSMQVAGAVGVMLIGWLIWRRLRARGDPVWWAALWLWCPTVVLEATQNAHIDWLGVLFVVVAFTAIPARHALWRGVMIGLATGVKLYPAVMGASLLRRKPVQLVTGAVVVFAVSYVPHVLAVGAGVLGFLPSYLQQEDYSSGSRYLLVSLVVQGSAATVLAFAILLLAVAWTIWRGDPEHPERTALVLFGTAMFVATPNQPWYALMLVALAVLAHRPEWLAVGPVMAVYYLVQGHVDDAQVVGRWGYIGCLLLVVGTAVWRHTRTPDRDAVAASRPTT